MILLYYQFIENSVTSPKDQLQTMFYIIHSKSILGVQKLFLTRKSTTSQSPSFHFHTKTNNFLDRYEANLFIRWAKCDLKCLRHSYIFIAEEWTNCRIQEVNYENLSNDSRMIYNDIQIQLLLLIEVLFIINGLKVWINEWMLIYASSC